MTRNISVCPAQTPRHKAGTEQVELLLHWEPQATRLEDGRKKQPEDRLTWSSQRASEEGRHILPWMLAQRRDFAVTGCLSTSAHWKGGQGLTACDQEERSIWPYSVCVLRYKQGTWLSLLKTLAWVNLVFCPQEKALPVTCKATSCASAMVWRLNVPRST